MGRPRDRNIQRNVSLTGDDDEVFGVEHDGGRLVVQQTPMDQEYFGLILEELRLIRAHLSLLTGAQLDEGDTDDH